MFITFHMNIWKKIEKLVKKSRMYIDKYSWGTAVRKRLLTNRFGRFVWFVEWKKWNAMSNALERRATRAVMKQADREENKSCIHCEKVSLSSVFSNSRIYILANEGKNTEAGKVPHFISDPHKEVLKYLPLSTTAITYLLGAYPSSHLRFWYVKLDALFALLVQLFSRRGWTQLSCSWSPSHLLLLFFDTFVPNN